MSESSHFSRRRTGFLASIGLVSILLVLLALGLVLSACDSPGIHVNSYCNGNQVTCNNNGNSTSP